MMFEFVLVWAGIPLAVAAVAVTVLAVRRRTPQTGHLSRAESWIVSLIGAGAMMTALFGIIGVIGAGIRSFGEDPYRVTGMPYGGRPVERLSDVASVADSGYESVWLLVTGIPAGARWLLFVEAALPALATVAVGVSVAWLAITLIRGRPFVRALPHVIGVAAVAVMIAGVGAQVSGAFARAAIVEHLGAREVTGCDAEGPCAGLTYLALNLDLGPIGWAFGLALVAAAFQIGTRLQRETDLLV